MGRVFAVLVTAFILIGGALVYQAARQGTSLVLVPSDLLSPAHAKGMSRIRVGGRVADLPIEYQVEPKAELKFSIHDSGKADEKFVNVIYAGLKPDMFAAGRDVIIDGEWVDNKLVASKLLTQCPSKYEPPQPKR